MKNMVNNHLVSNRHYLNRNLGRGGMRLSLEYGYVFCDVKAAAIRAKERAGHALSPKEKDYLRESDEKHEAYKIIARCFKKHGYDRIGRALYARLDKWGFVHA